MVGLPYDLLANPLGAVRFTFEKSVALGSDPATFAGRDWGATGLFPQFLFDNGGISQVPMLNPSTVKWLEPNTLVRFRGMVQDMLGNELYIGAYKDGDMWRTNKFADCSQSPICSTSSTCIWERRLLHCVPVPGKTQWIETSEALLNLCPRAMSPESGKRQRDDGVPMDGIDAQAPDHEFQDSPALKRKREDGTALQCPVSQQVAVGGLVHGANVVPEVDKNSFPCLVKMYDMPESDMKLNEVFEFVGVLAFESELAMDRDNEDDLDASFYEDVTVRLPSTKVPHLHCVTHRKLAVHDFIMSPLISEPNSRSTKDIRESLMRYLTAVLGNDGLTAHFMLLHLLSRVHARVDTAAVGKLSLNLTCFSSEIISVFVNRIRSAISEIVPFACSLPLTVDYLNSVPLAPRKDYQTNRLVSGVLQLAEGTHMIIDETTLQPGTLSSTGIDNARLLKGLMVWQKVEYDFTYYKMDMDADVQVLILSEGKSNILPADLVLPFRPTSVDSPGIVNPELLEAWRWYLGTVRSMPHAIEPEMQKMVEDDLVAARQADRTLGSKEFSRLLTIGRLISASFGDSSLSMDHWQMAKDMDRLMRDRLKDAM